MKLLFALFFLFVVKAEAHVGEAGLVKVFSGIAGAAPTFFGSGLLFKSGADIFVLTSDHVTARENGPYTHSVYNSLIGKVPVRWLVSDWGRGFALLQLTDPAKISAHADDIPDLTELDSNDATGAVVLAGFPAKSLRAVYATGDSMAPYSDRQLFLQSVKLAKVEHTQAEYGMSGGAMLDASGERPLGLLSHQQLDPAGASASGLVIPYRTLYPCLREIILEKRLACWNFHESTGSAISRDSVFVRSGPLQINFSWVNIENFSDVSFTLARVPAAGDLYASKWLETIREKLAWREAKAHLDPSTPNTIRLIGWKKKGALAGWQTMQERDLLSVLLRLDAGFDDPVFIQSYSDYDEIRALAKSLKDKYLGALVRFHGTPALERAAADLASVLEPVSDWPPAPERDKYLAISPTTLDAFVTDPQYAADWIQNPNARDAFINIANAFRGISL